MPYWSYGDLCWQMLSKQKLGVRTALTAEKRIVYLAVAFSRLMPRFAFQAISLYCGFSEFNCLHLERKLLNSSLVSSLSFGS
jgi:hypothetical protein